MAMGVVAPELTLSQTPAATRLRVRVFPGAQNLALFAAQQQGFFRDQGLDVELSFTQNSTDLRNGLVAGDFEIAHAAVDNAVAMHETTGHDIVIFLGGDSSMNELFVQPEITTVEQLRGRTLIVDAPNTAYALQARKVLMKGGLKPGDFQVKPVGGTYQRVVAMREDKSNAASTLNPPFSLQARAAGLRSLGRMIDLLGPYQASGGFSMRAWAMDNGPTLERYVAAVVQGLRWATARANLQAATGMLAAHLNLSPALAAQTMALLVEPQFGLTPDARWDSQGFDNVLALRAKLEGQWSGQAPPASRYVDLRWYEAGIARIAP